MTTFVIDASIAVKWVVEEAETQDALALRKGNRLIAPDLLASECANLLWKKSQRNELTDEEAIFAARLLARSDVELLPTRALMETATRLAIELRHPAYDCTYLALAIENGCRFVTADEGFARKVDALGCPETAGRVSLLGRDAEPARGGAGD
ncbi:MAG: type II toxin-antitoxin system VapC family toxin [Kiloniellales bacterium]